MERKVVQAEYDKTASQAKTQTEVKRAQQYAKLLEKSCSTIYSTTFTKNAKISKLEAGVLVQATLEHQGSGRRVTLDFIVSPQEIETEAPQIVGLHYSDTNPSSVKTLPSQSPLFRPCAIQTPDQSDYHQAPIDTTTLQTLKDSTLSKQADMEWEDSKPWFGGSDELKETFRYFYLQAKGASTDTAFHDDPYHTFMTLYKEINEENKARFNITTTNNVNDKSYTLTIQLESGTLSFAHSWKPHIENPSSESDDLSDVANVYYAKVLGCKGLDTTGMAKSPFIKLNNWVLETQRVSIDDNLELGVLEEIQWGISTTLNALEQHMQNQEKQDSPIRIAENWVTETQRDFFLATKEEEEKLKDLYTAQKHNNEISSKILTTKSKKAAAMAALESAQKAYTEAKKDTQIAQANTEQKEKVLLAVNSALWKKHATISQFKDSFLVQATIENVNSHEHVRFDFLVLKNVKAIEIPLLGSKPKPQRILGLHYSNTSQGLQGTEKPSSHKTKKVQFN